MQGYKKITSKQYPDIHLRLISGHFVTAHSHINYYINMSLMKARLSEASAIASALAQNYIASTIVDTILCMDGCEVIGAYLAQQLTQGGVISMNAHHTIYITTPEFNTNGQLLFRENVQPMIKDKHVLILLASSTTGKTLASAMDVVKYYGGHISGVSALFSAASSISNIPIHALFTTKDIPDYKTYSPECCSLCKEGVVIDALANGYGFARI